MMQKEVADRILAKAGSKDYGALTLAVQFDCTVERVMDIPPAAFLPHPAVTSTVLKIRRRKEPAVKVADRKRFFRLVKIGVWAAEEGIYQRCEIRRDKHGVGKEDSGESGD